VVVCGVRLKVLCLVKNSFYRMWCMVCGGCCYLDCEGIWCIIVVNVLSGVVGCEGCCT
jgi:hypothetical protein